MFGVVNRRKGPTCLSLEKLRLKRAMSTRWALHFLLIVQTCGFFDVQKPMVLVHTMPRLRQPCMPKVRSNSMEHMRPSIEHREHRRFMMLPKMGALLVASPQLEQWLTTRRLMSVNGVGLNL